MYSHRSPGFFSSPFLLAIVSTWPPWVRCSIRRQALIQREISYPTDSSAELKNDPMLTVELMWYMSPSLWETWRECVYLHRRLPYRGIYALHICHKHQLCCFFVCLSRCQQSFMACWICLISSLPQRCMKQPHKVQQCQESQRLWVGA